MYATEEELDQAMSQLEEVVTMIKENRYFPPPSPEIEALLEQALAKKNQQPDEAWAKRLAEDVSSLTD